MIRLENVSFAYLQTPVLQNITLNIQSGEFVGIIGPNGAGKSTTMKILTGTFLILLGRYPVRKSV
ncbi:MAG: ATP-binding cassette domain-containing protein, partial [Calditrichaeota bacterium]|nr:ATP-binding cassette domain-containing protein [Calditrichota bacterium]